jgi:sulfofructose kinase
MPRVLCVGIVVADLVFTFDELPRTPGKHLARGLRMVAGGMAANAAAAAARLGADAALMSRVGDDPNGTFLLGELAALGVDTNSVERAEGVPTSVSAVAVGEAGERLLLNYQDQHLLLEAPSPPAAAFGRFDATLVDTRWPAAGVEALRLARVLGVPGIADIDHALPDRWLVPNLALASHVVFSRDGLGRALGVDALERGMAEAARLSPGRIAVTLGGEGVVWLDEGAARRLPAFAVRAVDTLGAGDAFHGALAVALAEGRAWPEALRFAAAAAAIKCSRPSGRDAFPVRAEVERMLEEQG